MSSSWEEDSESSMSPLYPIASAEDLYWGRPSDSQTRIVPFASVARLLIFACAKSMCERCAGRNVCVWGGKGNALSINTRKDDVRTASVAMCPTRTREEACVKRCDTQRGQKKGGAFTLVRVREARFCA